MALLEHGRPAPIWGSAALDPGYRPAAAVGEGLPLLSPEIPETITIRNNEQVAALLAEALLAEGVLKEEDWDGHSITSSLGAGITRWASSHLGGQDLQRVDLGLFWTDNLQAVSEIDPRMWRADHRRRLKRASGVAPQCPANGWPGYEGLWMAPAEEPVGALAIRSCHHGEAGDWPHHRDIIAGPKVLELERVRKGLGFQIFSLLSDVLPPLIGVPTPHYAWNETLKTGGLDMVLKGGRGGVLHTRGTDRTPERLLEEFPREILAGELKPETLRKARALTLSANHKAIVEAACDVLGRFQALRPEARLCDTSLLCAPGKSIEFLFQPGMAAKLPTFCLRWSRTDAVVETIETYLGQLDGRGTNLAWCQAWVASDPESIRRAARNWRAVTSLALRACRLAELLHSEESQ